MIDSVKHKRFIFAIPPGETLKEELEAIGMSQVEFAKRTGRTPKTICEIINGTAPITAETAIQFERVLGVDASFWLNLERQYQEALAIQKEEQDLIIFEKWSERFPLKEMIEKGYVIKTMTAVDQIRVILNFFGVAGINEWENIWSAHLSSLLCRGSDTFQKNPYAVAVWLRKGELLASEIQCEPYVESDFREMLYKVRNLITKNPSSLQEQIQEYCKKVGIAVVFLPELTRIHLFGATQWLTTQKALIMLSLRGKTEDQFWFSFFHEAAHVILHGRKKMFIDKSLNMQGKEEEEADNFSADMLIPAVKYKKFVRRASFSEESIKKFAASVNISPGILVGRLQHEKKILFSHYNQLKVQFEWSSK